MASSTLLANVLLRLVLPFILVTCIIFRPCGLSFIYLLLFFYLPFVPSPTVQNFKAGHAGRFLRFSLLIGFFTVISQIIFQVVLLIWAPYGHFLVQCSLLEKILRHVGLIKVSNLTWFQLIRWLGPDAAALIGLIFIYLSISNILTKGQSGPEASEGGKADGFSKMLSSVGSYLILGFLCFTSSLQPSASSGVYFIVFIAGATAWATGSINIHNKCFAWIYLALAFYVAVHFGALFVYQLEFIQEILEPDSLIARLAGLVQILKTDCNEDPRNVEFNLSLKWPSWAHPFTLR